MLAVRDADEKDGGRLVVRLVRDVIVGVGVGWIAGIVIGAVLHGYGL